MNKESKDAFFSGFQERAQKRLELLEALQNKKQAAESEDDVDLFMKSVGLTVKKLPPAFVNEAKLGILTLVSNLQSKAMSSFISQTTYGIASTQVDPYYSSAYNKVIIPGQGQTLKAFAIPDNNPISISDNFQLSTSTIQSNPSHLRNSTLLNTSSEKVRNIPTTLNSFFQSHHVQQPNTSICNIACVSSTTSTTPFLATTLSNSTQSHDTSVFYENIDTDRNVSYEQLK